MTAVETFGCLRCAATDVTCWALLGDSLIGHRSLEFSTVPEQDGQAHQSRRRAAQGADRIPVPDKGEWEEGVFSRTCLIQPLSQLVCQCTYVNVVLVVLRRAYNSLR